MRGLLSSSCIHPENIVVLSPRIAMLAPVPQHSGKRAQKHNTSPYRAPPVSSRSRRPSVAAAVLAAALFPLTSSSPPALSCTLFGSANSSSASDAGRLLDANRLPAEPSRGGIYSAIYEDVKTGHIWQGAGLHVLPIYRTYIIEYKAITAAEAGLRTRLIAAKIRRANNTAANDRPDRCC